MREPTTDKFVADGFVPLAVALLAAAVHAGRSWDVVARVWSAQASAERLPEPHGERTRPAGFQWPGGGPEPRRVFGLGGPDPMGPADSPAF